MSTQPTDLLIDIVRDLGVDFDTHDEFKRVLSCEFRPGGLTLIPWKEDRCLAWDVTVADTFAATYVSATSVKAGEAAARLAANKRDKYEEITQFCPIVVETMDPVEHEGRDFLSAIGHLITKITGDPRETSFLFYRLYYSARKCRRFQMHFPTTNTRYLLGCSDYLYKLGISSGN